MIHQENQLAQVCFNGTYFSMGDSTDISSHSSNTTFSVLGVIVGLLAVSLVLSAGVSLALYVKIAYKKKAWNQTAFHNTDSK